MSKHNEERLRCYREKDWDGVIRHGENDLKKNPNDIKVLNDLARAYFQKGDYDRALVLCESIQKIYPSVDLNVQADELGLRFMRYHEILGEIYYRKNRGDDALRVFNDLKTLGPYFSKKYSHSAKIYINRKDFEAAAKEYEGMVENCPRHSNEATNALLDLVDMAPFEEPVYRSLFNVYQKLKQLPSAISTFEAVRKTGKAPDKFLFPLIHLYLLSGETDKASAIIEEEISKRPVESCLQIIQSRIFRDTGEFSKAETCIKKAMQLDKKNRDKHKAAYNSLLETRGESEQKLKTAITECFKSRRCYEAVMACQSLLKIRPESKNYQAGMIKVVEKSFEIYMADGKIDQAIKSIDQLAKLEKFDPAIPQKIAALNKRVSSGRIEVYENVLAGGKLIGDELDQVRMKLVALYREQGKGENRVIPLLEETLNQGGRYESDARYYLALELLEANKIEAAEAHVKKFAASTCSDEKGKLRFYNLGMACQEAGLKHQARTLFGEILSVDKNFRDAAQHMEALKTTSGGQEIPEAVMVVDICESSRMMDLFGDEATYQIKNALEGLMFPIFQNFQSNFTKSTGDGFLVCFPTSKQALDASIQVLRGTQQYNSKIVDGPEIHLRFGIHFGAVRVRPDGDRHGANVNIPFRVEGLKGPDLIEVEGGMSRGEFPSQDRILITEAVAHELGEPDDYNVRYVGLFELRNITGIHKIFEVKT